MAYDLKGEYKRFIKIQNKFKDKKIPFECGCACGYVSRIEYIPEDIRNGQEECIWFWGAAGWQDYTKENTLFVLLEEDVKRRYQDRRYRYDKKYNILELFQE